MPTNLLTNSDFSSGSSSWTTGSPLVDGGRTYTFEAATSVKPARLVTTGTGTGSISQLLSVSPGDKLFVSFRGYSDTPSTGARFGIYIPASGTYRHISDSVHASPFSQLWDPTPGWFGGEVVVPAGVTSVRVFVALPPGTTWISELNAYTSPNLVADGGISTNTDGTLGGDGGTPSGWTLDWHQLTGAAGGWTTEGGALKHNGGSDTSGCACQAFAVTAGERLYVTASAWGSITNGARFRVAFGASSSFASGATTSTVDIVTGQTFSSSKVSYSGWVEVPIGATYARLVVYNLAAGTCYWDDVEARRISSMTTRPEFRVEASFGRGGPYADTGRLNWVVGASGTGENSVGSSFLSPWSGSFVNHSWWTDITQWVRDLNFSRGRKSKTAEYENGSASFALDDDYNRYFDPLYTSGPFAVNGTTYVGVGRPIRVSILDPDNGRPTYLFTGRVNKWEPQYGYSLNLTSVTASEYYVDLNAPVSTRDFASQRTDLLLGAFLDAVNWPATARQIDTGATTAPALTGVSGSLLPYMRLCGITERGAVYLDGGGRVKMRIASTYRTSTVQLVIDDATTVGATGYDYERAHILPDTDTLRNRVAGTRYGGSATDQQVSTDSVSVAQLGTVPYEVSNLLFQTNAEVLTWTASVLAANSAPVARIDTVEINPEVNPAWWSYLLWGDFGDRHTVKTTIAGIVSSQVTQTVQFEALSCTVLPFALGGVKATLTFVPAGSG